MKMTREEANEILEDWNLCHYTPSREAAEAVISALDPLEIISALRLVSREQVSEFKTCDLVDELRKREGVETHIAEPYQDVTVSVNGPAVVLVVID